VFNFKIKQKIHNQHQKNKLTRKQTKQDNENMRLRTPSQAVGKVIAANQKWRCGSCCKLLEATYQIDHRKPLCQGGKNSIENLWVLCANCHALKTLAENQSLSIPSYGKMSKSKIALVECPFYQNFKPKSNHHRTREERLKQRTEEKSIDTKHSFSDFKKGDYVEVRCENAWVDGKVDKCIHKSKHIVVVLETLNTRRCVPTQVRHKI